DPAGGALPPRACGDVARAAARRRRREPPAPARRRAAVGRGARAARRRLASGTRAGGGATLPLPAPWRPGGAGAAGAGLRAAVGGDDLGAPARAARPMVTAAEVWA